MVFGVFKAPLKKDGSGEEGGDASVPNTDPKRVRVK